MTLEPFRIRESNSDTGTQSALAVRQGDKHEPIPVDRITTVQEGK